MECERCGEACILCLEDWPWNEEYWICPKCDSTYVKESDEEPS